MATCCRTTCSCVINAGDRITITGNGSATSPYVISADQTVVQVTDTDTVDMTISGTGSAGSPYNISSVVKLDATPPGGGTNLIQSNAEGLYLECAQVRTCFSAGDGLDYNAATGEFDVQISGLPGNTTTIGGDGGVYTASSGQVEVDDTDTVDMTLAGTGTAVDPYVVTADVILDPTPPGGGTNLIGSGPEGLYLECAQVRTCVSAGDGLDYNPATGEFDVQISNQPGNTTTIGPDGGVYTPAAGQLVAQDSDTIDHTLAGTGTPLDPYVLTSVVKLDPTPPGGGTNLIGQTGEGLYLECAQVRTCFTEGNGIDYDPVTGVIAARISTDGGNAVQFGGDGGLWAPVGGGGGGTIVQVSDTASIDSTLTGTGTALDPYVISSDVRLDPTPPDGGTNLIRLGADGLYLECTQVRTCFTEGDGIDYDPVTGVIAARVSTDPGNVTTFGGDGGIYTPGGGTTIQALDTPTVDTTVTGTGTALDPYVVSGAVILDPAPPGGGTNLINAGPDGLYLECAQVRTCFSAGDGASYDPVTGLISARLSTDAGNATIFGTDGGLYSTAAALVTGCGLDGAGTALDPLIVAPEAGQEAWPWTCDVATESTLKCDPNTNRLWTPPEHFSAEDHIYVEHFLGGVLDPIGPTGGWSVIDPGAIQQFNVPPNFIGNNCRPWGYVITNSGDFDLEFSADAVFEVGYVVIQDGGAPQVRPLWGQLTPLGVAGHIRASGSANEALWNIPATTGSNVTMFPAINVIAGTVTINNWTSDATIVTTTNTP
ncbi:hypothetical protein [Streptomyces sp. 2P-4]|uniref:hypothetical protein n=1 Tax=Streptomyces sp. 2P-4 TaxID=2931974 RepID=UPI00253FDEEE|nr:hypothetical protein [Streptomyces sp. 2P-4]